MLIREDFIIDTKKSQGIWAHRIFVRQNLVLRVGHTQKPNCTPGKHNVIYLKIQNYSSWRDIFNQNQSFALVATKVGQV